MNKKWSVGIIGATGYVGQRLCLLLENHPWFEIKYLFASQRSAGKTYGEVMQDRFSIPHAQLSSFLSSLFVHATEEVELYKEELDLVFCAVNLDKTEVLELEEKLAKLELPIVSNNSAHRMFPDIPTLIPELNADHLALIEKQRKRLQTKHGFIVCKPNCSIQSYVPALYALRHFGLKEVLVSTYQAISGAGKTFETWPEMQENLIPYIGGEEEKSEQEPLKVMASLEADYSLRSPDKLKISAQCYRVAVAEGHTASVWFNLEKKVETESILEAWKNFKSAIASMKLPSAPVPFLLYHAEENRPQPKIDLNEEGMRIHLGRLRKDHLFDFKFTCLSHNTLRGAAGGAVLSAELLAFKGYLDKK